MLDQKQLAFLVGAPRSGTTWLQLLISRSPSVATGQETDLFNKFLRAMADEWNRYRKTGKPAGLTEVLSEEELQTLLRGASEFVFAKIAQGKPGATVVLEKTPNHVQHWREILELWPGAHFIHIVRDPRSVVASLRFASKNWGAANWGGTSRVSAICQRWISDVSNGRQIGSATHNYQEVTYEDLVSDGPEVLLRLLNGLGVRSGLEECRRYVQECSIDNLKTGKLDNAPFDMGRRGKYRFRIGTTDSWRDELSKREIAIVERLAGPLMTELGFKPMNGNKTISALVDMEFGVKAAAIGAKRRLQGLAKP